MTTARIMHDADRGADRPRFWNERRREWTRAAGTSFTSIDTAEQCIKVRRLKGHVVLS